MLNISNYEPIILIFSVNLSMVFISKFCKTEIQIQPPGEPREQHLGENRQGTSKLQFNMDLISLLMNQSLDF